MTVVIINNNSKTTKAANVDTDVDTDTHTHIEATTIINNLILQQPTNKDKDKNKDTNTSKDKKIDNTEKYNCCECYYRDTLDSRCCGLCFYCGDYIYCKKEKNCFNNCISPDLSESWCFKNPYEYFASGCFLTSGGYGNEPDCCCTVFAGVVLCKFALTFPWLLCSTVNGAINCMCETDKNYLL